MFCCIGELPFKQIVYFFKDLISDSELGALFRVSLRNDRQFKEKLGNLQVAE